VLADEPLEIEIEAGLGEDEYLLPIAFDGEHLHFVGHPSKTESGKVSVSIDEIPEIPDDRRSIGRAIKFYFFKSYLKFREVNRLAWIEYKDDGTFERHDDGVKEKVAKSKRVLLLIHGIIGNTDGIVEGLKLARDGSGRSVDQKYDVVLTYDYENLSTPIEETARELKRQLGCGWAMIVSWSLSAIRWEGSYRGGSSSRRVGRILLTSSSCSGRPTSVRPSAALTWRGI
jgi:hypothetical protein